LTTKDSSPELSIICQSVFAVYGGYNLRGHEHAERRVSPVGLEHFASCVFATRQPCDSGRRSHSRKVGPREQGATAGKAVQKH